MSDDLGIDMDAVRGATKRATRLCQRLQSEIDAAMSEMRTPGPWTVTGCAGGYLIEQNRNMDHRVVRGSGGIKSRADALLIAAAPDLLDACEIAAEALGEAGLLSVQQWVERAMIKATRG